MEEKITAQVIPFSVAEHYLTQSLAGDSAVLKKQCDSNRAKCWRLNSGQAYMLTRAENQELVVCCFEGQNLGEIITHVIEAAKNSGFTSIRFHTKRPAITKLLKQEFGLVESIFRRKI